MAILQRHLALRGFADMGDDVFRFDRAAPDQLRYRRCNCRLVVDEMTHPATFEKGDTPTVAVMAGLAAARGKAGKTEHNVGRHIAVHSK